MSCPPPKPPGKPSVEFTVTGEAAPAPPAKDACDLTHNICVQCGMEMNLVKTKWICPKCRWIVGCCD
jgi:hypothetical protein